MLTTDPIYYKALLPVIVIRPTDGGSQIYRYDSFTGGITAGPSNVFPIFCSVTLSQNTHGEFVVQFEDASHVLESTGGVTAGSRVQIFCGKQSGSLVRLISGVVRRKGYSRGSDNRMLYTISGSSTAIRLNERVIYNVSEAARTSTGQIDTTDANRKADTLLETLISPYFPSSSTDMLSVSNLATNSDVETFIPSVQVEYGELQDLVNYLEDQTGGEVIVDTSDVVHFRYEPKNTLQGRGFTLKNSNANAANDDADDTMYLRGKNWSYEDSFYKSDVYGNRVYGLLPSVSPTTGNEISAGGVRNEGQNAPPPNPEYAAKFRPSHSHFRPGDLYIWGTMEMENSAVNTAVRFRIVGPDTSNQPNSLPVIANIDFSLEDFPNIKGTGEDLPSWNNTQLFYSTGNNQIDSFDLSTVNDYWLIMSDDNMVNAGEHPPSGGFEFSSSFIWNAVNGRAGTIARSNSGTSSNSSAGSNWNAVQSTSTLVGFEMPRNRAQSFIMWDPKATNAIASGMTAGQTIDSVLSDVPVQVTTKDAMCRHLSQQLYSMARPRTTYSFPKVTAPNIPPLPGDPIVISDDILGFSATGGNQVVLAVCGDMTYSWGQLGSGNYEAPTNLAIQAVAVHPRYR